MSSNNPDNPENPVNPASAGQNPVGAESIWQAEPEVVVFGAPVINPPTSSNAIVSLVLAIMSWVVCPIIFAIIALVFANKADKEIAGRQGQLGGSSLVLAAKIVSWINIGFYAALLILGVLAFFFVALVGVASN
jgi:hypothetical protein